MAMGCGIVSIDLLVDGQPAASAVLFWLAVVVWVVLAVRWIGAPSNAVREFRSPAALGCVAATAVLGARVAGQWHTVAAAAAVLLVVALAALGVLLWPVLSHWTTPTVGGSFLVTVATQGVAGFAAVLAAAYRADWLLYAAIVLFAAGLAGYLVVLWRFDFGSVGTAAGDQWVAGGALAISTLAVAKIAASAATLAVFGSGGGARLAAVDDVALALWCGAMVWLIPLVVSEFIRPRLAYHVLRWATVFPVGMYAACSFAVGQVTGIGEITDFARIWTPVAVAVTLIVLIGLTHRALQARKSQNPQKVTS
jgi:tellurite resistance protein TehA-like permease